VCLPPRCPPVVVALVGVLVLGGLGVGPAFAGTAGGSCAVNWAQGTKGSDGSLLVAFACDEPAGFAPEYSGSGVQVIVDFTAGGSAGGPASADSENVTVSGDEFSGQANVDLGQPPSVPLVLTAFTLDYVQPLFSESSALSQGDGTTVPPDPSSASTTTTTTVPATTTTVPPTTTTTVPTTTTTAVPPPTPTTLSASSAGSSGRLPYDSVLLLGLLGSLTAGALFSRLIFGPRGRSRD
jgi:hypothetical protein